MAQVLTFGEPMGLLVADEMKLLKDVAHYTRYVCGAEVNFSVGMSRLGHDVAYISRIGRDPFGEHIDDFLRANHIETSYLQYDLVYNTGMQLKEKAEKGRDPMVVNFRKNTAFTHYDAEDIMKISWGGIKHLHLTGIPAAVSIKCREAMVKLLDKAKQNDVGISFDPNLRLSLWSDKKEMIEVLNELAVRADIVLPGIKEGEILTGECKEEAIADFYLQRGVKAVVIKNGSEGAFTKLKNGEKFRTPAFSVSEVVDTVGAGDGFAVGVISALLEGEAMQEAVRRGAAIGAMAVMAEGDNEGLPDRQKLQCFLELQANG